MLIKKLLDGTDPGATPGAVFTASIGRTQVVQHGAMLSHLMIGMKGDIDTAAVAVEAFIDTISEFVFSVGSEDRIKLDGNDLVALAALYYKQLPTLGENSDNTGTDWIGGLKVPIQAPVDVAKPMSYAVTFADQANQDTETLAITGHWLESDHGLKPINAQVVSLTSAGATGNDIQNWRLPNVGKMVGLIVAIPAASDFTDANIDVSVQRIKIIKDGVAVGELNTLADAEALEEVNFVSLSIFGDLLARYKRFDFRPEGFDLKSGVFTLTFDNEDASDAIRVIPIVEIE